jgi:uncharacterized protein DUF4286
LDRGKEVIYSVTLRVDSAIAGEWLTWMQTVHLPNVMATGSFLAHEVRRQIEPGDAGRVAFEIRYLCASREEYQRYQELHAARLQAEHTARYGERVEASRRLYGSMETQT